MHYDKATGEPVTWHWLMYADGPLAGRTCVLGWYANSEIPERVTATAGTVLQTRPVPIPGEATRCWHLPVLDGIGKVAVAVPGRPVRYQLEASAYRFVGEGYWPEHESVEADAAEAKAEDWQAEHEMMD